MAAALRRVKNLLKGLLELAAARNHAETATRRAPLRSALLHQPGQPARQPYQFRRGHVSRRLLIAGTARAARGRRFQARAVADSGRLEHAGASVAASQSLQRTRIRCDLRKRLPKVGLAGRGRQTGVAARAALFRLPCLNIAAAWSSQSRCHRAAVSWFDSDDLSPDDPGSSADCRLELRVASAYSALAGAPSVGSLAQHTSADLSRVSGLGFGGVIERLKRSDEVGILRIVFEAPDNGACRPNEIALSDETPGGVRRRRLAWDRGRGSASVAVGPNAPVAGVCGRTRSCYRGRRGLTPATDREQHSDREHDNGKWRYHPRHARQPPPGGLLCWIAATRQASICLRIWRSRGRPGCGRNLRCCPLHYRH